MTVQTSSTTRSRHLPISVGAHKHVRVTAVLDPVEEIPETLAIPIWTAGWRHLLAGAGRSVQADHRLRRRGHRPLRGRSGPFP